MTIIHDKPKVNKRIAKWVQVDWTAVFMIKKITLNAYIFAAIFKINLKNNKRMTMLYFA